MQLQDNGNCGVFDSVTEFRNYALNKVNTFFSAHPEGVLLLEFKTRKGCFKLELRPARPDELVDAHKPVTWNDLIVINQGKLAVGNYLLKKMGRKKGRDVVVTFSKMDG